MELKLLKAGLCLRETGYRKAIIIVTLHSTHRMLCAVATGKMTWSWPQATS